MRRSAPRLFRIGFCTDLEGNFSAFQRYAHRSAVLKVTRDDPLQVYNRFSPYLHPKRTYIHPTDPATTLAQIELRDGDQFVYGGDCCDHGTGEIQLVRTLVSLKERYPNRIHLLLGNRDINKAPNLPLLPFLTNT